MPDHKRPDPFKPQQPQIPGVEAKKEPIKTVQEPPPPFAAEAADEDKPLPVWVTVAAVAVLVLIVAFGWWAVASPHHASQPTQDAATSATGDDSGSPADTANSNLPTSPPGAIGTVSDFERPWTAKRFIYRGPAANVPAMAVSLPGGAYWGFALKEPYGDCKLEFVTDLGKLASKYHFTADHPMVGDPCTGTVYDLMQYGNAPSGLVRGAIQRGAGLRPPIAIEIATRGKDVVAVRME